MNSDVALYLHESNAVDLLLGIATRSNSLRLTEICIGLLGNMACQEQVRKEAFASRKTRQVCYIVSLSHSFSLSLSPSFPSLLCCVEVFTTRDVVLSFLCGSDTRILYEATRLVLTCVSASDKDFRQQWIEEVRLSHNVKESLQFVMKSSTNGLRVR
ncbi:Protein saal1 [Geodia barretti]|uniref:Protein saal1 n=1 Tax=Geodia barretti TaxID=519541 RepID=A0AA35WXS3_GEOBA|nr:Protein saal1 [Geodia barretti]